MQKIFSTTSPFSQGLPALYVIAFLAGISVGLFNPFIAAFMTQHQVDEVWIGANSTVYFLAIALGTPLVSKILPQIGLRRTMMLGLLLTGFSAPLFPLTTQLSLWFAIRVVMGIGVSLYLVSQQTGLNYFCHDSNRAIVSGLNALFFSLGFGLGPIIGSSFYNISPKLAFALGGILILSGIVVVWIGLPEKAIAFHPLKTTQVFKKLTLPLQGAFAYGFTVSTLVSLYPVYLLRQQLTVQQMGYTFSVFVVGSLLATVPITHLADRLGRVKILGITACVALFSLASLSVTANPIATPIFALIAGASVNPIFPIALALIGEKLAKKELSSGSALFTGVYGAGCTAGPLLSSVMMNRLNERYIFSLAIVIFAIFILNLLFSKTRQRISKFRF